MSLRTFGLFLGLLSVMLSGTTALASEPTDSISERANHCLSADLVTSSPHLEGQLAANVETSTADRERTLGQLAQQQPRTSTQIKPETANQCGQCQIGNVKGFDIGGICIPCGF